MAVGIILAGGVSRRFRGNKLIASLNNRPVLEWVIDALSRVVDEFYLSIRLYEQRDLYEDKIDPDRYGNFGGYIIDSPHGTGPYNSILTSLQNINADELLIIPGDIPWVKSSTLERLIEMGREHSTILACPIWGNGWSESLILYFNLSRSRGIINVLRYLRMGGRATDIQRATIRTTFIPVSKLTGNPSEFIHVTYKSDLKRPRLRNPVRGFINETIHIDRGSWSELYFIKALESISERDYFKAISYLASELEQYISYRLMQLIEHVASDIKTISMEIKGRV